MVTGSQNGWIFNFTRGVAIQTTVCPSAADARELIIPECSTRGSGLFCLPVLSDYFSTCIGLSHLTHSKFLEFIQARVAVSPR